MRLLSLKKVLILTGLCCGLGFPAFQAAAKAEPEKISAKNIIFMVPDGMGLSNVTIARIYKNGPNGAPLNIETLPYIGYQRTCSRNSTITDSAAAASAWASGEKFNNGEISCLDMDRDGACDGTRKNAKTILELALESGLAAGLVVTSDITHATPAAWAAHVHNRKCESEIFRQMMDHKIDVLLGGGVATNRGGCKLAATNTDDNNDLIRQAVQAGYSLVKNRNELANAGSAQKLLGLFRDGGLTPSYARNADSSEPTLAGMTGTALKILEKKAKGFFLLVEGSQIDWGNHARNVAYQIGEVLAFDESVKIVKDWINADETRKNNTLLIVVADHETGGVIINGPYGSLSRPGDTDRQLTVTTGGSYGSGSFSDIKGKPVVRKDDQPVYAPDMDVRFGSKPEDLTREANHTGVDTIIWSNSPECARAMDNTELYGIMADFIKNSRFGKKAG